MEELKVYLITLYHNIYDQATRDIFTRIGLIQLGILVTILVASYYLAMFFKKNLRHISEKKEKLKPLLDSFNYFYFPIFFFIIASAIRFAFQQIGWNDLLFNIFVTYFAVRIINRLLKILFKNALWLPPVRVIIWIFALLKVLKLLDVTLVAMDKIGFDFGGTHLSLLILVKGVLTILITLWLADKIADLMNLKISKSERLNPSLKILLSKTLRITLLIFAILIAIDYIGIKLTAFAVLGGAIGVGIGFGLQKIVSNFVCGFFLLMDKSVKPGDVIEIANTFGTIQSLSGRYITVLTIEGKEHLIPNEDLITQRVVNWSHSNRFIRLAVDVGVAYSTDIPLALKLLEEATANVKRVSKYRAPQALITNFGNSSIDLRITFWIKDPEFGTDNITSNVRLEIWKIFKKNNIQIPFPQNDVYIKSMPEQTNPTIDLPIVNKEL
ncbi:MAG: mechanosensitive ion channel [Candidatus Cloacimonetes bacterium]|nr:mechanosensitive ion channel [Candidatus Cloacimonadota bacterium]